MPICGHAKRQMPNWNKLPNRPELGWDMDEEDNTGRRMKRFHWARVSFDLEGIVGALAAWLVGILLGMVWSPLFWIGAAGAILVLLATRRAERSSPEEAGLVIAPCDGIVAEITPCLAPSELRLPDTDMVRVRIASSPASTNTMHAPITGVVETMISEEGDPSAVFATRPDGFGLQAAYVTIQSGDDLVGMKIITGGLGPRLDIDLEQGDTLRGGRVIGQRRLGGWCDVYLQAGAGARVWKGQSLIGGETVLAQLGDEKPVTRDYSVPDETGLDDYVPDLPPEDDAIEDAIEVDEIFEEDEEPAREPETSEEASAMSFERLVRETRKRTED